MFDYRKLPLIIIIAGIVLFTFSGLLTVLNVTNSGIKMDMYLCQSEGPNYYLNKFSDNTVSILYYYPREYIYNKKDNASDVCSYQKRDVLGKLTPKKYEACKDTYVNVTKKKYESGKCQQIGKEIIENDVTRCETLYVWKGKKLISINCEGGTTAQREATIENIQAKYK